MNNFLKQLDVQRNRTVYIRITALSWNEQPIEMIEGRTTGGSVNIDGNSTVRRSCSLTMVAQDININEYLWGYKTKFKLEIGLQNNIEPNEPDIIWYKQGIFVITSFACSISTNSYTINIQGKDKMCLLNGEVGGGLTAQTQFDSYEQENIDGNYEVIKYPIKQIIRDGVHQFANEPLYNIVINDIDDIALELLEYQYDEPMYIYRLSNSDIYENGFIGGDIEVYLEEDNNLTKVKLNELDKYDSLVSSMNGAINGTKFRFEPSGELYCAAKIEYGDTAGYRQTELIYNDDLILNAGEALTNMLDKLKNMLGQFEYFYDVDGRFIFQKKKNGIQTVWTPIVNVEDGMSYVDPSATPYYYRFQGGELFTAFSNSPNMANLRNDFSVWGTRADPGGGEEVPIHMRYAIDEKPVQYTNYEGQTFIADDVYKVEGNTFYVDWRELLFQMQADYRKHNHDDDFYVKIMANNPWTMPSGMTGYEQYYIDIEGFWRQLYYPEFAQIETLTKLYEKYAAAVEERKEAGLTELEGQRALEKMASFKSELQRQVDAFGQVNDSLKEILTEIEVAVDKNKISEYYLTSETNAFWNKMVYTNPSFLCFWFDFMDVTSDEKSELAQYSNRLIGNRPKVVNDKDVKSIYFRETPAIIFATSAERELYADKTGYRYFNMVENGYENMFSLSTQGKSAKDSIDELVYNHSYAIEAVSITTIPIYHLEPNIRIYICDANIGVDGDYIATKYTIPLQYNGTMSITATKAPINIF